MSEQLALRYDSRWVSGETWARVLAEARRVIVLVTLKQVAFDLDVSPSIISLAVGETDRHYFRGEWLVYLVSRAPDAALADAIVAAGNLETQPRRELTTQEKYDRLTRELDKNPTLAKAVYEGAGLR